MNRRGTSVTPTSTSCCSFATLPMDEGDTYTEGARPNKVGVGRKRAIQPTPCLCVTIGNFIRLASGKEPQPATRTLPTAQPVQFAFRTALL